MTFQQPTVAIKFSREKLVLGSRRSDSSTLVMGENEVYYPHLPEQAIGEVTAHLCFWGWGSVKHVNVNERLVDIFAKANVDVHPREYSVYVHQPKIVFIKATSDAAYSKLCLLRAAFKAGFKYTFDIEGKTRVIRADWGVREMSSSLIDVSCLQLASAYEKSCEWFSRAMQRQRNERDKMEEYYRDKIQQLQCALEESREMQMREGFAAIFAPPSPSSVAQTPCPTLPPSMMEDITRALKNVRCATA